MGNRLSSGVPQQQTPYGDDKNGRINGNSGSGSSSTNDNVILRRPTNLERRITVPIELEDPEDCTVGEAEADLFPLSYEILQEERIIEEDEDSTAFSLQERLHELPKEVRNILAGGIAGIVAKTFVAPLDRIKILYQVSAAHFRFRDIPRVAHNIIQSEGLSALFKGNTATLIRVFPYSGIQFMVFDRCKHYFLHEQDSQSPVGLSARATDAVNKATASASPPPAAHRSHKYGLTPIESLVSGMIAGTVSVICTYPLDLTRTQLAVLKKKTHHNAGFVHVLADNYKRRGVVGLFRGITPTLLGILPYSGIAFALNEQGKREIQHLTGREVTTVERMQCGALSGLVAQTITYPIEVTRRRMQTIGLVTGINNNTDTALSNLACSETAKARLASSSSSSASTRAAAASISPPTMLLAISDLYAEQGMRGFLKGVSMNWMKGPVAFSISFTAFDNVQRWMESPSERTLRRLPFRNSSIGSGNKEN